jgi:hypothetical protein
MEEGRIIMKIPDTGYRIPDTGCQIPDTGFCELKILFS